MSLGALATLVFCALCVSPMVVHAQEEPVEVEAEVDFSDLEEMVVWGDLFARWDDTRWYVQTEVSLPSGIRLAKDENIEFSATAYQIRTVVHCEKTAKLSKKKHEVDCFLEDFGIKAALRPTQAKLMAKADARLETRKAQGRSDAEKLSKIDKANLVLNEIDAKLEGARLQLQVSSNGRVTSIDLEGMPESRNQRERETVETLRQILSRVAVGFDMKLRKGNQLNEGKWVEYKSALMTMPTDTASSGASMLVHYLNKYKGHVIVQSIGKGTIVVEQGNGLRQNYATKFVGVSLFDPEEGYMTERVWALNSNGGASNMFNSGSYYHSGRIRILNKTEKPDCGTTEIISPPGADIKNLPKWVPIDRE